MPGTSFQLEVNPQVPPELARLEELAGNLWYSWDIATRSLFARIHTSLWHAVNHNPKSFLKRVSQKRLRDAAADPIFLDSLSRVLSAYDNYHRKPGSHETRSKLALPPTELIAYFCAEFGFHESLPIYSGGLGILAGDHCKGASDLRLPFVAVGLLYAQGYFQQTIDRDGRQHPHYSDADFDDLPITPVRREDGSEPRVQIDMPGRTVWAKIWTAQVGNARLYLLDTALEENTASDRDITHRLYGGDRTMRLEQEILLGIGGVRALQVLGLQPTVWHINEGHAAFLILERIRDLVAGGLDFDSALEAVAVNTVFTTHTAVPAGHDHFADDMMLRYFDQFCEAGGIPAARLLEMGHAPGSQEFNMTALAIRGSRHHNGVSRIHGHVSSEILAGMWPQIEPAENPVDYVTNGVHASSFLAADWYSTFDRYLGPGWMSRLTDRNCWQSVQEIPDQTFWSIRQALKAQMLRLVRSRVRAQHLRNKGSQSHVDRMLRLADPGNPTVLTIGFARRFATYKRATLLFNNVDLLREILGDAERPVLFIFAGKAHPADEPGQELIRRIHELSRQPEFEGRILLLENYDLHLARRLVSGVDVWLNNPVYPLEASGTSGMKAAINGAMNLSVLDGWWDEGCDGRNGWEIKPATEELDAAARDAEEARTLYELLQDSVVPLYYNRNSLGYSAEWVEMAKHSISTIMPRFNIHRMLGEYTGRFYTSSAAQWHRYSSGSFAGARQVAAWKARVRGAWQGVALRRLDTPQGRLSYGTTARFEVAVRLNGLTPDDVTVELLFGRPGEQSPVRTKRYPLRYQHPLADGEHLFSHEMAPDQCGKLEYRIRVFPRHELLTHPFEMGMMVWL